MSGTSGMSASLTCKITLRPDALELTYTLANGGRQDLGVFNWVPWNLPDGTLAFMASAAYVELVGDILFVRKMALPIPEGLQMAAYAPPPASPVPANTHFAERILLSRPVKVMHPFRAALAGLKEAGEVVADKPASAVLLRLEIGVFPLDEQCRLVSEHPAHPRVFTAAPLGPAVARQQVLRFDAQLDQRVDVLDYRAVPWP